MNRFLYDYLIVGSGFFGATCAYELRRMGKKVLVLEKRKHIGGNCYTEKRCGIDVHMYGPHIFHTSNETVWKWINQFTEFNNFTLRPIAITKRGVYSLPFNMWTFSQIWSDVKCPAHAKERIAEQSKHIGTPTNLEEAAIKAVGTDVYNLLIKGYTEKQWQKPCTELPASIIKRLPVRFTYDNNYFQDPHQGIPVDGYTEIFKKLLNNIEIRHGDYLEKKSYWDNMAEKVIYTGPIDKYYGYVYGDLEYKTSEHQHFEILNENYQGVAMANYTDHTFGFTRIIEHKHFNYEPKTNETVITIEYPQTYTRDKEPMYPVNDDLNNSRYGKYKGLADSQDKVLFGGRLAEYKYYNMDQVIESALTKVVQWMKNT
jgi:UDP-galactopyranose mutase